MTLTNPRPAAPPKAVSHPRKTAFPVPPPPEPASRFTATATATGGSDDSLLTAAPSPRPDLAHDHGLQTQPIPLTDPFLAHSERICALIWAGMGRSSLRRRR